MRLAADEDTYALRIIDRTTGAPTAHGVDLISVTTVLDRILAVPFSAAANYGFRLALDGLREVSLDAYRDDDGALDVEAARARLKALRLTPNEVRDDAASRGTAAHEVCERLAAGWVPRPCERKEMDGYALAALSWFDTVRPDVLYAEHPVYSLAWRVAGTADIIYREDGRTILGDFKTHKPVRPSAPAYVKDLVQVSAYAACAREMGIEVDEMRVIVLGETGRYAVDERQVPPDAFGAIVSVYRLLEGWLA